MQSQKDQSTYYAQAVAGLVAEMSTEQAIQVYDFARFLRNRPTLALITDSEDDDWLHDSEEQMQAEDALWEATFARQRDTFDALLKAAYAEIKAGTTRPMFDEDGNLTIGTGSASTRSMIAFSDEEIAYE